MSTVPLITQSKQWLSESVFPLWLKNGVDTSSGAFVENLSHAGEPLRTPQRAMVQARHIYAFAEGVRLKVLNEEVGRSVLIRAARNLVQRYSLESGAFLHSVDLNGNPVNLQLDLYTQGFVLFGLSQAYAMSGDHSFKTRALNLLDYLYRERRHANGGFTEIIAGHAMYEANPHMHLFEAAISWMKVDANPRWADLAQNLFVLCHNRFIDKETDLLCEHFDSSWAPLRQNGKFVFEPGHHCEWAWLILEYANLCGQPAGVYPRLLFEISETFGKKNDGLLIDEVWSDFTPKKRSSRFWPQSERVKAAMALRLLSRDVSEQQKYASAADEGLRGLMRFFEMPVAGLWQDTLDEKGDFVEQPVKASSLYHIINAISEYVAKREMVPRP